MKKTIIALTLLSFAFLSLHVHIHENDQLDHASDYNTVKENCDFCQFNSDKSFAEASTSIECDDLIPGGNIDRGIVEISISDSGQSALNRATRFDNSRTLPGQ